MLNLLLSLDFVRTPKLRLIQVSRYIKSLLLNKKQRRAGSGGRAGWLVESQGRQACWTHGRKTLHCRHNVGEQQGAQDYLSKLRKNTGELLQENKNTENLQGTEGRLGFMDWLVSWAEAGVPCLLQEEPATPPASPMPYIRNQPRPLSHPCSAGGANHAPCLTHAPQDKTTTPPATPMPCRRSQPRPLSTQKPTRTKTQKESSHLHFVITTNKQDRVVFSCM